MQLYALYANICNPKYMQKYSFENMQNIQKYAKICIEPTSIDLIKNMQK